MASQTPPRSIIHLDLDAFYASVEQLDNPELRGRPVIVGGTSKRGAFAEETATILVNFILFVMIVVFAHKLCPAFFALGFEA